MHLVYQCPNPDCDLRFTLSDKEKKPTKCPRCGSHFSITQIQQDLSRIGENPPSPNSLRVEVLLDNIRSTLNVGSIFRTADGAGVQKIHLCGITPTPNHPKIVKTGLGAEWSVAWDYHPNGLKLALHEKRKGVRLICLELSSNSKSIFTTSSRKKDKSVLLILGNEVTGVDPEIAALCDETFHIPMAGYKKSLNVSVAFGILAYQFLFAHA